MTERKLRLVHSTAFPETAKAQMDAWKSEHARQPDFFDGSERLKMILVPVNDFNWNKFSRVLDDWKPKLIIETRLYPHYHMIYSSISSALKDYDRQGIEYKEISLYTKQPEKEKWEQYGELKSILISYIGKRTGAPVLLLLPNIKVMNRISDNLEGYISQEVAEMQMERLER